MKRILEDLFYGNIQPNVKEFVRDSRYGEITRAVAETEQKLLAILDSEARQIFESYVSAQSDHVLLTAQEHFIGGFRIGARMAAEVWKDYDGCLYDIN